MQGPHLDVREAMYAHHVAKKSMTTRRFSRGFTHWERSPLTSITLDMDAKKIKCLV